MQRTTRKCWKPLFNLITAEPAYGIITLAKLCNHLIQYRSNVRHIVEKALITPLRQLMRVLFVTNLSLSMKYYNTYWQSLLLTEYLYGNRTKFAFSRYSLLLFFQLNYLRTFFYNYLTANIYLVSIIISTYISEARNLLLHT